MISLYLKTIKRIFQSPVDVVDTFLKSDEKRYLHPFKFLILCAIPFLIISSIFVDFSTTEFQGRSGEIDLTDHLSAWIEISTIRLSTQYLTITLFLAIPLLSLPALFFLRDELEGFYSHLILNSYAIGAAMLFLIAVIPVWMFMNLPMTDPFMHSILPALVICMTIIWVYQNYFSIQNILGWVRILSSYICGYLLFMIVKGLFAGVIGYMFFAVARLAELSGS